jgi:ADP-ribosylglycohydrolase
VSQLQAAMTHGHPTALAAAELTACATRLLVDGVGLADVPAALLARCRERRSIYLQEWLGSLWQRPGAATPADFIARGWDECLAILDKLQLAVRTASPEDDPCLATGAGWTAEEALATGLLCFLLFPGEPLTALRRAACTSGDSDSIACLTGAFAGAHHGTDAWPTPWADRIEYGGDLQTLGALWDA